MSANVREYYFMASFVFSAFIQIGDKPDNSPCKVWMFILREMVE